MLLPPRIVLALLLGTALVAGGCEQLGIHDPAKIAAEREAEGRAIGAGCRHSGRSLEDCYGHNEDAHKAAVFAGWREMNDYMAANNIAAVPPVVAQAAAPAEPAPGSAGANDGKAAESAAPAAPTSGKH